MVKVQRAVAKRKATLPAARVSRSKKSKVEPPPKFLARLKAVAINLKSREDRWKGLQKSIAKNAPWLKVERLDAVDGRVAPPPARDVAKQWSTARLAKLFHWYRPKKVAMSPGERGCCASHLRAWQRCAAGRAPLVVLEDDAVLLPGFTQTLAQAL